MRTATPPTHSLDSPQLKHVHFGCFAYLEGPQNGCGVDPPKTKGVWTVCGPGWNGTDGFAIFVSVDYIT